MKWDVVEEFGGDLRARKINADCYGGDLEIGDREFHGHDIDSLG